MQSEILTLSVPTRPANPTIGGLVTVRMYNPATGKFDLLIGARLERVFEQVAFVKLIGLSVPEPYMIGDKFPIDLDRVVDWE